jgi:ADP-heptose:LPS heptosyltransferase
LEIQPETALVLHPGSGSTGKNLDLGHYFKLAEVVKTSTHLIPVLLMGPAEEERLGGDLPPYPTVRGLDLEGLTGFLACEPGAVLTHDSGVGHLAGALGLRVLSIFLTTDPRVWAPWFPGVTVLCCGNEVETAPVHDSSSREWKASGPRFLKYRIRSMSDCDSVNRLRVYLETEF